MLTQLRGLGALQGYVLLVRQEDRPGIIAAVSTILGKADINISFMTVTRSDQVRL